MTGKAAAALVAELSSRTFEAIKTVNTKGEVLYATGGIGLLFPTSLCSGQAGNMIAKRLHGQFVDGYKPPTPTPGPAKTTTAAKGATPIATLSPLCCARPTSLEPEHDQRAAIGQKVRRTGCSLGCSPGCSLHAAKRPVTRHQPAPALHARRKPLGRSLKSWPSHTPRAAAARAVTRSSWAHGLSCTTSFTRTLVTAPRLLAPATPPLAHRAFMPPPTGRRGLLSQVRYAVLLEHGCEKTHNDAFSELIEKEGLSCRRRTVLLHPPLVLQTPVETARVHQKSQNQTFLQGRRRQVWTVQHD